MLPATATALFTACSDHAPSVLEPAGRGARRVEGLWWVMLWISVVVFVVVAVMLVYASVRGARASDDALDRRPTRWGDPFIAVTGVFVPFAILAAVYLLSLREMNGLASEARRTGLAIEVIGHDWWWEARYPNGAITANEIHIPVGEAVRVDLTTADVIHSFWVPRLQVKVDQIPGQTNRMWLEADQPGTYRGQCAEFCGLQHANMVFYVIAEPPDEFAAWVENEARPASVTGTVGEDVFMRSSCVGCHTIRGTEADAVLGPDLTHVGSRRTLAGVVENTPANLLTFVHDPHEVKPGVSMPPTELTESELQTVVQYLMRLD